MEKRGRGRPMRVLTAEEKEEIIELYCNQRRGVYHIGQEMHIHVPVIVRWLASEGIMRTKKEMLEARSEKYAYEFTREEIDRMTTEYTSAEASIYKLATEFEVSERVIKRLLLKEGVEIRDHLKSHTFRRGRSNKKRAPLQFNHKRRPKY